MTAKVGHFATRTTVGTQAITGLGFQPKALILYSVGNADATPGWSTWAGMNLGFASGSASGDQKGLGLLMQDNAGLMNSGRGHDQCVLYIGGDNSEVKATLQSFDAGGFTLNYSQVATARRVHYLALGGSNFVADFLTYVLPDTGNGSKTVSGLAFQPTAVLAMGHALNGANGLSISATLTLGAYDGTSQWYVGGWSLDGPTTATSKRISDDAAFNGAFADAGTANYTLVANSFNSGGMSLGVTEAVAGTADDDLHLLFMQGAQVKVGQTAKPTGASGVTQDVTGLGFQPEAIMLFSVSDTGEGIKAGFRIGIGASDGSHHGAEFAEDQDVVGTSNNAKTSAETALSFNDGDDSVTDAEVSAVTMLSGGFRLTFNPNNASAYRYYWIAFGPPPVITHTAQATLAGSSAGTTTGTVTRLAAATLAGAASISATGVRPATITSNPTGPGDFHVTWRQNDETGNVGIYLTTPEGYLAIQLGGSVAASALAADVYIPYRDVTNRVLMLLSPTVSGATFSSPPFDAPAHQGVASLGGTSAASPTGTIEHLGAASLDGTSAVSATGQVSPASVTHTATATLAGTGAVAPTGQVTRLGAATLAGTGTVDATGSYSRLATATLTGAGTVAATGLMTRQASATLAGTSTFYANGYTSGNQLGQATLAGAGALLADGQKTLQATATMAGTSTVSAIVAIEGEADLFGIGSVFARATLADRFEVWLLQGETVIARRDFTPGSSLLTFSLDLTAPERDSITNWENLRLRWRINYASGGLRITQAYLEGPQVAAVALGQATLSGTSAVVATGTLPALFAQATISGQGAVIALATPILTHLAAAAIAGQGAVTGLAGITLRGQALIVGVGIVLPVGLIFGARPGTLTLPPGTADGGTYLPPGLSQITSQLPVGASNGVQALAPGQSPLPHTLGPGQATGPHRLPPGGG